jgi:hypothetical protein
MQTAAVGDYALAREQLRSLRIDRAGRQEQMKQLLEALQVQIRLNLPFLLSGPPAYLPAHAASELGQLEQVRLRLQAIERCMRAQQADLRVLEGMLALEEGDTKAAQLAFIDAQKMGQETSGHSLHFAGKPIAGSYLDKLRGFESTAGNRKTEQ